MLLAGLAPAGHTRSRRRVQLVPVLLFYSCALSACAVYDDLRVGPAQTSAVQAPAAVSGQAGALAQLTAAAGQVAAVAPDAAGMPVCAPLLSDSPCERLPRLTRAPSLDGELECGLTLLPLPVAAQVAGASERVIHYAAAFSDAGLYLYVRVQGLPVTRHAPDQPLFCGDAVELFVDADGVLDPLGNYESSGTLQFVIAAPGAQSASVEAGKFMQGKPFGPWVSTTLKLASLPNGYAVEVLITAADLGLWSWQPEGRLGFDLALDFAAHGPATDPICSTARDQTFLRLAPEVPPCAGQPWCDTRSFCVPQLAD